MKLRAVLFSLLALLFAQASFAGDMPPSPGSCPDASELKSGGFLMSQQDPQGHGYVAFNLGNYGTQHQWGFVLGFIDASNEFEALMKANMALKTLSGNPRPMPVEQAKTWACLYQVDGGSKAGPYQAIAMSPLPQGGLSMMSMLK